MTGPSPALPSIPAFRPSVGETELEAVGRVFASGWLGMGQVTRQFEAAVAEQVGARHVVAVSKGTSALHLALDALELAPGDEVLVPSMTFVATIQAIWSAGLTPVFCEVRPETLNLDVEDTARRITARSRAVMPVHYAGEPCEMDALQAVASAHELFIVEDAAHAFGSTYGGRPVGTLGDLTCFSFDAIKNITCGEGGAVATERADLTERIRRLRCLGIDRDGWDRQKAADNWQYTVVSHGHRYHMSDINAAIGLAQLARMETFQRRRLEIARRYDEAFEDLAELQPLRRSAGTFPFAYVVRAPGGARDALAGALRSEGIASLVQFTPNHLQPAFAAHRVPLPVTEELFEQVLSLPFHVEMTDADVARVITGVRSFFGRPTGASAFVSVPRALGTGGTVGTTGGTAP